MAGLRSYGRWCEFCAGLAAQLRSRVALAFFGVAIAESCAELTLIIQGVILSNPTRAGRKACVFLVIFVADIAPTPALPRSRVRERAGDVEIPGS